MATEGVLSGIIRRMRETEKRDRRLDAAPPITVEVANAAPVAVAEPADSTAIDGSKFVVKSTLDRPGIEEYAQLVNELGIAPYAVRVEALRVFLAENGITIYPFNKVDAYLQAKAREEMGRDDAVWVWRPLRERDSREDLSRRMFDGSPPNGSTVRGIYQRPIPLPVLMTMKKIQDAFPEAQFHASDYAVPKPDPFLAVTMPGSDRWFIIERWDEPGFRM